MAIVHVPGQRGGNITMCAAISLRGLLHHHAKLGPYNMQHICNTSRSYYFSFGESFIKDSILL